MKTLHQPLFYNSGLGHSIRKDLEDGTETFEHGQVVLIKDHHNWSYTQKAFAGFDKDGIMLVYATAHKTGGVTTRCNHFYRDKPSHRRLSHLPKIGEILYRRHIWNYPDKPMVCNQHNPYWDFKCEIVPSNHFDYGFDEEGDKYGPYSESSNSAKKLEYSNTGIREYKVLECPENPEWEGTNESCIMEFHTNGAKKPTGWNIHFCEEV
jgi:hypothetical protein